MREAVGKDSTVLIAFRNHQANGMTLPETLRKTSSVPEMETSHLANISAKTSLTLVMSCCTPTKSSTPLGKGNVLMIFILRMSKSMYLRWTS